MEYKNRGSHSEPDLLVRIGGRLPHWAALVGLVGEGQEIYSGEEAGIAQWRLALEQADVGSWEVCCPPLLAEHFAGLDVHAMPELALTVPLRSRQADDLDQWVAMLLEGEIASAAAIGQRMAARTYPIYVTRDLAMARSYAEESYNEHPDGRYGLVVSSQAKGLAQFGVDNSWFATGGRRFDFGRWYNDPPSSPESCCSLATVVTEFGCQGLELDLPILCWGDDLLWLQDDWHTKPIRRRYPQNDPDELLRNSYRVLLTRGRDGIVIGSHR